MINKNGLTSDEVIKNRKKYGNNSLTKKNNDTFFKLLLETLSDPIIKILLIALGIKTIFLIKDFDWYETVGIVIAIMVASLISSISEYGSMRAFNKLTEETSLIKVRAKRDNKVIEIPINDVVYNDIILLGEGDKVPADGIIVSGTIAVDESMLNGEAKEKYKKACIDINKIEDENKVYMSSVVYNGSALMLVTQVGDNTIYGKLAQELQEKEDPSPLKLRLTELAKNISRIGYVASFLVAFSFLFNKIFILNEFNISMILSTLTNYKIMFSYILEAMTLCVTIIVVAVPEGLPMMITLVLSSNMKTMLKNNVLVRKLMGIETAGNINVLFTDKTGTLTNGKLEVVGILSSSLEEIDIRKLNSRMKELFMDSLSVNNESVYDTKNNKIIGGNITDKAILNYVKLYKSKAKVINRMPFSSEKKYMFTKIDNMGNKIKLIKGAPEVIINASNSYYDEFGIKKNISDKNKILSKVKELSGSKLRLIAIAISDDIFVTDNLKNITLLGFIVLADSIRENVLEGINLVKSASIQTIMITGDNKETAVSIARELNLIESSDDIVITSDKLDKMTNEEIIKIFPKIRVIARAMPSDKSRLVNIAHEQGMVCGMTGDGVNDAPALKKADVGFAMGSGTEVAKEASDIVILDNNFMSIAQSVLYGRTIFKSIRKFIICQLTINLCSLTVSIIGPFIGIPVPITVVQMLWINMIMDTLSGLAFSYEPALNDYMKEPPKKKSDHIINRYMVSQILVTGIYSSIICIFFMKSSIINNIYTPISKLTAFFGLLIFISIFNALSARTNRLNIIANIKKNKVFIAIIGFITIVQIFIIYKGGNLFRTHGLNMKEFIIMFILSISVLPVDFIRKIIIKMLYGKSDV
ncbi:MAG: calcium-translocating P-type ATPase, PMCA-type [Clostridium sp.]|jgi:Ca2+-transporting ATPase|nr:calcium-translocating P-type ATPase, PMCA-type [Clostridium sp.]